MPSAIQQYSFCSGLIWLFVFFFFFASVWILRLLFFFCLYGECHGNFEWGSIDTVECFWWGDRAISQTWLCIGWLPTFSLLWFFPWLLEFLLRAVMFAGVRGGAGEKSEKSNRHAQRDIKLRGRAWEGPRAEFCAHLGLGLRAGQQRWGWSSGCCFGWNRYRGASGGAFPFMGLSLYTFRSISVLVVIAAVGRGTLRAWTPSPTGFLICVKPAPSFVCSRCLRHGHEGKTGGLFSFLQYRSSSQGQKLLWDWFGKHLILVILKREH